MRILSVGNVYPPHHLGGYEVIWRGVTRHLQAEGHASRVLTTTYRRPDVPLGAIDDPDVHRDLDWYWRDHAWRRLTPLQRLALERRNARLFDRHLVDFGPDVIAWWPMGGMSLGLLERARRAGVPAVLFILDPWPSYGPQRDGWIRMWRGLGPLRALGERWTGLPTQLDLPRAGRWVFCSASMRDQTLAAGLRPTDCTILTPGVESRYLAIEPDREPVPWRWRLLYIGRVVEQKGVNTAIECLPRLPEEATLTIVGPGDEPYRRQLEALADRLGVRPRVSFEPPRPSEELPEIYHGADAVLHPVRWAEPWGLVPLEAMALGRPVIATGRGGSAEYLINGRNALLFEAGDAAALARCVARLAQEPELRERLRVEGRRTAERHSEHDFNRRAVSELEAARSTPRSHC